MIYKIKNYNDKFSRKETFVAIKFLKDEFENILAKHLNLKRVSSPLFVLRHSGLNDDLNGVEQPIRFHVNFSSDDIEIVQSLAKWKRDALKRYHFDLYEGLYCDMNAIRKDEITDNIHSLYVDQWDWEKIIALEDRNLTYLFNVVQEIFLVLKEIEKLINARYPFLKEKLPKKISFISSEELLKMYPNKTAKEREYLYLKEHRAAFIYQIGKRLSDGSRHDNRAADYDDWSLNGDILVFDDILDSQLELSSMGIRVDKEALVKQLCEKNEQYKLKMQFSKDILHDNLPYTIGGGIGQSRLCLFFLEKAHIGEVQASLWDEEDLRSLKELGINLL